MKAALDVAVASCGKLSEHDPDQAILSAALERAGICSEVLAWDDPGADFARARLTVLRSTWNYPLFPDEFIAWLERVAAVSELWNPLPVVRWNLHKKYLLELEASGVPVTPTEVVPRGARRKLEAVRTERGWGEVVVKPAVSASSMDTIRVGDVDRDRGEEHLRTLAAAGDVLVQPYLTSVEEHGERSVVWIDGEQTHAIRKSPRFVGGEEVVSKGAVELDEAEAELAERALEFVRRRFEHPLLYARVDMAPGAGGAPVVMELELVEPSLYLVQSGRALSRLVAALRRRLKGDFGNDRE